MVYCILASCRLCSSGYEYEPVPTATRSKKKVWKYKVFGEKCSARNKSLILHYKLHYFFIVRVCKWLIFANTSGFRAQCGTNEHWYLGYCKHYCLVRTLTLPICIAIGHSVKAPNKAIKLIIPQYRAKVVENTVWLPSPSAFPKNAHTHYLKGYFSKVDMRYFHVCQQSFNERRRK